MLFRARRGAMNARLNDKGDEDSDEKVSKETANIVPARKRNNSLALVSLDALLIVRPYYF